MLAWHRMTLLLVLASSFVRAQLIIENPKHVEISEPQAQVLFLTTTRVMESEFHSPGALENTFRLRLVLGQKPERFTIDDPSGNGTLYLESWNEGKFAVAAMRLAVQHLLVPDRQQRMLQEILRRTQEMAPVSATRLAKEGAPPSSTVIPPADGLQPEDDCTVTMANAAVRGRPCSASRPVPVRF